MSDGASIGPARRLALGELLVALGFVALGLFFAVETAMIEVSPAYSRVGPRVFPYIVAAGIVLVGGLLALKAVRGGWMAEIEKPQPLPGDEPIAEGKPDLKPLAIVCIGLALDVVLMVFAGFVVASAVLFFLVSHAFGSRHYLRDAAIALALALAVYAGFTYGLGLTLPAGILTGIL